jgi:ornithine carbamoyltransferase
MRHYLSVDDLSPSELGAMLDLAVELKADPTSRAEALRGRSIALIFEKPSTRTRVSFEVGVVQLGAHPVVLSAAELQLGRGETIQDTGRVLSRYVDAIVLRTFEQERLEVLATTATGAHALYTDVWASMGQEEEASERALVFPAYQVNQKLVDVADPEVVVLHCLPAHRGLEITDEVIDGPRSAVWDQAENRLHTQKALLLRLAGVA